MVYEKRKERNEEDERRTSLTGVLSKVGQPPLMRVLIAH